MSRADASKSFQRTEREARPFLGPWALAGFAVFVALAAFEVFVRRPGLGAPEELAGFALASHPAATWRWWLRIGGGAWSRGLMALALAPGGPWQSIYVFNLLALSGAAWGLWRLGKRLGGEAAGAFSLLFLYFAPFSFLQARTTFNYVLVPALLLLSILALRRRLGTGASALLGLMAALAWTDYEAWILAAPALALAWWTAPKGERPALKPLLAGLCAGCLVLGFAEAPYGSDWLFQRGHGGGFAGSSGGFLANLKGFFFGSTSHPAMGLETLASFPWIAWPGFLVGAIFAPTWLWLGAAAGLLGLCAGGPFMEPNRAIAAWPLLLLISGLGSARMARFLPGRFRPAWLGVALVLAPVAGYFQFNRAISVWDAAIHGPSRAVFQMADFLKHRAVGVPVELGPALEFQDTPLLQRCVPGLVPPGPVSVPTGAELWFLIPRDLADPSDPRWGRWVAFSSPGNPYPLYLLRPSPRATALLLQAAKDLAPEPSVLSLPGSSQGAALGLAAGHSKNPWSWTAWSGLRLRQALAFGTVSAPDVLPLLQGPCLSLEPLETIPAALGRTQPQVAAFARKQAALLEVPGRRWDLAFGTI